MGIEHEAKLAINTLTELVDGEYMSGYDIVKMMPESLIESLEGASYALAQENDHWSEAQQLTEGEYYE